MPSRYFVDPEERANKAPMKQETAPPSGPVCIICGAHGHLDKVRLVRTVLKED